MAVDAFEREVLALALPAFGALAAPSILLLTDAAFIGSLGTTSLAGYAGGAATFGVATSLGYFLAFASTSVVARRYGAQQLRRAVSDGIDYIALGLLLGVLMAGVLWVGADTFTQWIGVADAARPRAVDWLRGAAFGAPGLMASMAAIGLFRGLQDTRTTLRVTALQVVLNIAFCAALVFLLHLNTFGAGLAVALAETFGAVFYLVVVFRQARALGLPARPSHLRGIGAAFTVGVPLLWRGTALRVVLMGTTVVAARLGSHELAAFHVSLTVWYMLSNLLDALAIAAQAMIGKRLGASEGHIVHAMVDRFVALAGRYGCVVGLVTLALAPVLPMLFSTNGDVRHLMSLCLLMVGLHQPLAAIVFLLDGVLIGSGDSRYIALVLTAAMFVFLPAAWGVLHWQLGVVGLWCAMIAFMATRAALMWRRSQTDAWIIEGASR